MNCSERISDFQRILDAKIYKAQNAGDMDVCTPSSKEVYIFYDSPSVSFTEAKEKLEKSWSKFVAFLSTFRSELSSYQKEMDDKKQSLHKQMLKNRLKILYCLNDLGLACAYEAVNICMDAIPNIQEGSELYEECFLQSQRFLQDALYIIENYLPHGAKNFADIGIASQNSLRLGYVTPKMSELLHIIHSFRGDPEVIFLIFVERIITARVIERFMKKISCLSQYTFALLTGRNSSTETIPGNDQHATLELFCSGKQINFLFATNVSGEGIHVPHCSFVVQFDLPKTLCGFVQSRGRVMQDNSRFILMLERGNLNQRNEIFDFIMNEHSVTETILNQDPSMCLSRNYAIDGADIYRVDASGAYVSKDSCVNLIYQYCSMLPSDKYFTPRPIFEVSSSDDLFLCRLKMPPNAAFGTLLGPLGRNIDVSKQLVCLEACKRLHHLGALSDNLIPSFVESTEKKSISFVDETCLGAGTTKRKELHGSVCPHSLHGSWGENFIGVTFHSYRMDFTCTTGQKYAGFILILESNLDDDVGNLEFELFLHSNRFVKTSISPSGDLHLEETEIRHAKCFQEFFFNGVFGRLFIRAKSGRDRKLFVNDDTKHLWVPSNMYLLLPLDSLCKSCDGPLTVNWTAIKSCNSVVSFLKNRWIVGFHNAVHGKAPCYELKSENNDIIYLANDCAPSWNLKNRIVVAVHTGKFYSILDLVLNLSAESPFDAPDNATESKHENFVQYFAKKYGITLMHPLQPLVLLKQSHKPHNLLVDFSASSAKPSAESCPGVNSVKPKCHVYIPPELLIIVDAPLEVLKSLYLLPSVMHRLHSLMLASQLRNDIAFSTNIPTLLILEAMTTVRCYEDFSLERLELLGDSVLQYAVSCHLFLKYPNKHEGQLSLQRSQLVCNSALHKAAVNRKLQGYIRDCAFDPRRWVAPGQLTMHPVPCSCGVDSAEVPLEVSFQSNDNKSVRLGITCDKGHRWICSKTLSDCVEALIGAYYVGGGMPAALHLMKWLGIETEIDLALLDDALERAGSLREGGSFIESVESKLEYAFSVKGLVVEAMTHPSSGAGYCYQRLEFLGDSVLGLLVTQHVYESHEDIDPGMLTDLRSASVSNENLGRLVVKWSLQEYLQHSSDLLSSNIAKYCDYLAARQQKEHVAPKVLGDIMESIAGAVLIDSMLDLSRVWRVFERLLMPIVSPDSLELHPLRRLHQLCDSCYSMKELPPSFNGEYVQYEIQLRNEDALLVGHGSGRNQKFAKRAAARHLLRQLLEEKKKHENGAGIVEGGTSSKPSVAHDISGPVMLSVELKIGGPRLALNSLCKGKLWTLPTYEFSEVKARVPMEFADGRTSFSSFQSTVTLHLPQHGVIECTGDRQPDKKSSRDSAALAILRHLQSLRIIILSHPPLLMH